MNLLSLLISVAATVTVLVEKGIGAVQTDPPSGAVVPSFEGTLNATTLTCNVTDQLGNRAITSWSIGNFRGASLRAYDLNLATELFLLSGDPVPGTRGTFDNRMTILNLTSELDRVVLYCGLGGEFQANFTLRVYRPPSLRDNFVVRIEENSRNVPVDILLDPEPFPLDTISYSWTRNGLSLTGGSGLTLEYSSVMFSTIERSDVGEYSVFASNHASENPLQQIGNGTGSFSLDVIYGPTFMELGPMQHYVLLGNSLPLICGTGLESNPQAIITWRAPAGTTIMDNARYTLDNGPDIVRLNITHTLLNDTGMWFCEVIVRSERHTVSNGTLVLGEQTVIGTPIQHQFVVVVVAPPGQPNTLSVDCTKPTSVLVNWNPPLMADSPITYYSVRACNLNITAAEVDKIVTNTTTNTSFVNVTGLLPGTTYELTVVAVSQGGNVVVLSRPSDPVVDATEVTVPALSCDTPVSSNGVITVTWSYIHTGGLPLTNVSVSYTYEDGSTISSPILVPVSSLNTVTVVVTVSDLEFGLAYIFNITAQNSNGSSSILCGPTLHTADKSGSISNLIGATVGGIVGGCLLVGIIATLIVLLLTFVFKKRGMKNMDVNTEAVYEEPDSFQQYTPRNDQNIELKDCPAYEKQQSEIELEECPAYVEKKKGISNIELEECPAYVEKKKDILNIELEECPAYGQSRRT